MAIPYFGSKQRLLKFYPKPHCNLIIEPFCGSAKYSCKYKDYDIWINDKWEIIYRIWKWIQEASKQDIKALPEPKQGEKISELKGISEDERLLLSFLANEAAQAPRDTVTSWSANVHRFAVTKNRLLNLVGKIDHWKITNLDYMVIPNQTATWFVDPPYQFRSKNVPYPKEIDYKKLGKWCQQRKGQIIVCEGEPANWLPFVRLNRKSKNCTTDKSIMYDELVWGRSQIKVGLEPLI